MTKPQRHPTLLVLVHWLTALLVVIAYLISEGGRQVRLDPPTWHFATGFLVLLLLAPRLVVRFTTDPLQPPPGSTPLMERAAKAGHGLLYLLLILVPLTGWYAMSRMGVKFFVAGWQVPPLTGAVPGRLNALGESHQVMGNAILILAGLHALAALWHQFKLKDGVLARMRLR